MLTTLKNLTRTLLAAVMALSLMLGAAPALAQSSGISLQDAERIALQLFPGATVTSVERETEHGVAVYEVELDDEHGVEHEVILDARDGRVIRSQVDD